MRKNIFATEMTTIVEKRVPNFRNHLSKRNEDLKVSFEPSFIIFYEHLMNFKS